MPLSYEKCGSDVEEIVARVAEKWHPELIEHGVRIGCLYAFNASEDNDNDGDASDEHALKLNGYPAAAIVRKTNLRERASGLPDAQIVIDQKTWEDLTDEQHDALIDHELTHLELSRGDDGRVKTDDRGRPKIKMRLHDFEIGGFREVASRHHEDALEVRALRNLAATDGQLLFGFAAPALAVA